MQLDASFFQTGLDSDVDLVSNVQDAVLVFDVVQDLELEGILCVIKKMNQGICAHAFLAFDDAANDLGCLTALLWAVFYAQGDLAQDPKRRPPRDVFHNRGGGQGVKF